MIIAFYEKKKTTQLCVLVLKFSKREWSNKKTVNAFFFSTKFQSQTPQRVFCGSSLIPKILHEPLKTRN